MMKAKQDKQRALVTASILSAATLPILAGCEMQENNPRTQTNNISDSTLTVKTTKNGPQEEESPNLGLRNSLYEERAKETSSFDPTIFQNQVELGLIITEDDNSTPMEDDIMLMQNNEDALRLPYSTDTNSDFSLPENITTQDQGFDMKLNNKNFRKDN